MIFPAAFPMVLVAMRAVSEEEIPVLVIFWVIFVPLEAAFCTAVL